MISALNISRITCRGTLLKTFQTRLGPVVNTSCLVAKQKDSSQSWIAHFSTSQCVTSANVHTDHSHPRIWTAEKFVAAGLVGLIPVSLAFPNPACDYALALALTIHVHWGLEAIAEDYARPNMVGAALSRAAMGAVYALSVFTLGGLFYFNYNDVGLGQAIRMLWKL